MSKGRIFIIWFAIGFVLAAGLMFLRGDEDAWLCENGEWVSHGNPSAPKPEGNCE